MITHDKIEQWQREIEIITNDVTDIIESQYILNYIKKIVTNNKNLNSSNIFWDHILASFGAFLVLGISRQVDNKKEVISLFRLLKDIENNASIIKRDWFSKQYEQHNLPKSIGEQHFSENFGSKPELDIYIVKNDIQTLTESTSKIKKFRHTKIAHKNADKNLVVDLNFSEIENALSIIEKIVIKYQLLLNQSGFRELMPTITYDWEKIFRKPWIE
jgi:hypothetical protein